MWFKQDNIRIELLEKEVSSQCGVISLLRTELERISKNHEMLLAVAQTEKPTFDYRLAENRRLDNLEASFRAQAETVGSLGERVNGVVAYFEKAQALTNHGLSELRNTVYKSCADLRRSVEALEKLSANGKRVAKKAAKPASRAPRKK